MEKKKILTIIGGLFCIGLVINVLFPNYYKVSEKEPNPTKVEKPKKTKPEKEKEDKPVVATTSKKKYSSISNYLKSNTDFEYITSMTDSISKSKADIYESPYKVSETVSHLSGILLPKSKKILLRDKAIILKYSREEVFIYLNQDNTIYVQVSNEDYLSNQGYNSTYRPGSFFRTYGIISLANDTLSTLRTPKSSKDKLTDTLEDLTKKNTSTKNPSSNKNNTSTNKNSSNSIKDSSVGSRPSTGGGTSFGK